MSVMWKIIFPARRQSEDEETIAKILESQANDENMVDENGNLIGKPAEAEEESGSPARGGRSVDRKAERF